MKIKSYYQQKFLSLLERKPSIIDGNGLFATTAINPGKILFVAADMREKFGGNFYPAIFVNHSEQDNIYICRDIYEPKLYFVVAKRKILPSQELLLNYAKIPSFLLSQKDRNMLADLEKNSTCQKPTL